MEQQQKEDSIECRGVVSEMLGNGQFSVEIDDGRFILAHLSGRLRQNRIRVLTGDKVRIEMSPYDLTKGRITFREKA